MDEAEKHEEHSCQMEGETSAKDTYLNLPEGEESRILLDCLTNQGCTLSLHMQHISIPCLYPTSSKVLQ